MDYEHIDQETFWTLYHSKTHIWGRKVQTHCVMLLVNYPDSQKGQLPAHEAMQESCLCTQLFCICLGVYLLSQQTVYTEVGHILNGQFLLEIKLIVVVWHGWKLCQRLRALWWDTRSLWNTQCPKILMDCVLSSHYPTDFPLLLIPKMPCQRGSFLPIFFASAWTSVPFHIIAI